MIISQNINYQDLYRSTRHPYLMEANRKALESNPVYLVNAVRLCFMVIQPLFDTDYIDNINGFFRYPELNLKVKGP